MAKGEKVSAEQTVRDIRRQTRRKYNAEEKIRIVLEGLRGEASVAELCHREGINPNLYYKWSKEFLEAGKARLTGDTKREATSSQVDEMRQENEQLKQVVAELLLKNRVLKKVCWAGRRANGRPNPQFSSRKVRNHPTGGKFRAARQADIGRTGYSSQHLLPLVGPLSGGRVRRVTGSPAPAAPVLEPHPPDGARPGGADCFGTARSVTA